MSFTNASKDTMFLRSREKPFGEKLADSHKKNFALEATNGWNVGDFSLRLFASLKDCDTNDIFLQITGYQFIKEISHSLRSVDMTGAEGYLRGGVKRAARSAALFTPFSP